MSPPLRDDELARKRRRLGTALHELATELARERRRNAQLEREIARLRASVPGSGTIAGERPWARQRPG